jgi:hypothetical protein
MLSVFSEDVRVGSGHVLKRIERKVFSEAGGDAECRASG